MQIASLGVPVPVFLAPMAAVTDLPFRTVCEEHGAGFTITEFLSADGLTSGAEAMVSKLEASLDGRAFGVQIFGRDSHTMARAAMMGVERGASLIDINMGCPAKKVVQGWCGSALMKEPALAQDIVRGVRAVVPAHIPVTVKHRAGWDERHLNAPEFASALVEAGAAMITVHGRTRAQGFSGQADLEVIRRVRQALPSTIPVVGNGDVVDLDGYRRMRDVTGCDGVMIGRGALGNPWFFRSLRALLGGERDPGAPSLEERRQAFRRHVTLIGNLAQPKRHVTEVRKACAWYSRNQANGAAFRNAVFKTKDLPVLLEAAHTYFDGLR